MNGLLLRPGGFPSASAVKLPAEVRLAAASAAVVKQAGHTGTSLLCRMPSLPSRLSGHQIDRPKTFSWEGENAPISCLEPAGVVFGGPDPHSAWRAAAGPVAGGIPAGLLRKPVRAAAPGPARVDRLRRGVPGVGGRNRENSAERRMVRVD